LPLNNDNAASTFSQPQKTQKGIEMKKGNSVILGMVLCLAAAELVFAQPPEDIQNHQSCKYCAMDRGQFAHSRMEIAYNDASVVATCSIHCAAVDLALNIDKTPKSLMVGDYNTKNLINAEKAFWVIGGNKPGVMTHRAKWAFENKNDAQTFITQNGGKMASFDEAMKASYEDIYQDTKMIRDKRKMKMMEKK
jgi:copper chaperone NosL